MKRHSWLSLLMVLGASFGGGSLTSRLYWGYWLTPPSPDRMIASLTTVDSFSSFGWKGEEWSGPSALMDAAKTEIWGSGEDALGRLPAALMRRGLLPLQSEAIPKTVFVAIRQALERDGLLPEARPEYPYAREIVGHVALGRDAAGNKLVVAALHGGQASNDHYRYYEGLFSSSAYGELSVMQIRRYWTDYAGLEGIAHWLGALAGLCFAAVMLTSVELWRFVRQKRGLTRTGPVGAL